MMNGKSESAAVFLHEINTVANWKREQTLGSGSFAIITLWVNTDTNERIALKQYKNNTVGFSPKQINYYHDQWKQEMQLMRKLKCENVVKTLDLPRELSTVKVATPVLGLEFCSGGDLRKLLNRPYNCCGLEEKEVRQILKQISKAIEHLHSLNIIHRDLKPENIVLQPTQSGKTIYKLTDLGNAKQLSNSALANSFVGTLEYLAPELFMRENYSSSVDNWSFGLLAHEVITGRRPFLPNHTIAEILEALKKKKGSDICTEVNEKGGFYFSQEISQFNRICSILKSDIESWLKVVLSYDPNQRGGKGAFRMITELMNKYIVQVLAIETYELFSYEIDSKTTLEDLREKIFSNTNISPSNQYLILPNGEAASQKIGKQIIDSWYSPESWFEHYNPITLCAFDQSREMNFQEFYKSLTLPPTVEKILLDPGQSMDYDELKLTWRCSVWVAQQSVKKYSLVHEAVKSIILNCIQYFNQLQNKNHCLAMSLSSLFTSVHILATYVKSSSAECRKRPKQPTQSDQILVDELSEIVAILKRVYSFRREQIQPLFEKSRQIIPKFSKNNFMFEIFFKSPEVDSALTKKCDDIQNAYETLRKKKKAECNNVMVNLLCDCFKLVEKLIENLFQVLSVLVQFIRNIHELHLSNEKLRNTIGDWKKSVQELHRKTWKKVDSPSTPASSPLTNTLTQLNLNPFNKIKSQLDKIEQIFFDFESDDQLWLSKKFDFQHLEFSKLLF